MGQQWILGVPFDSSEWSGDNFMKSHYDNTWFQQVMDKERQLKLQIVDA